MIHQDIVTLLNEGKVEEAEARLDALIRKRGISGHDQQLLVRFFDAARARIAPKPTQRPARAKPIAKARRKVSTGKGK